AAVCSASASSLLGIFLSPLLVGLVMNIHGAQGSLEEVGKIMLYPAVGFLTGWILLLDYLLFPTLVAVLGGVAVHAILPQIPVWV
ncbi:bile acid:sodium symporter, partial [Salmonella enterica subsp. enterica serovar Kentucky]|nr:bile acid:sodium symporter [Salmonella enterica subsp. enterica serovar Kentucky]